MKAFVIMMNDYPMSVILTEDSKVAEAGKEHCAKEFFQVHHNEYASNYDMYRHQVLWWTKKVSVFNLAEGCNHGTT